MWHEVLVDIGDVVKKDQTLIKLSIPELIDDVEQKEALVAQAEAEVKQAESAVVAASAAAETAQSKIKEMEAGIGRAEADLRALEIGTRADQGTGRERIGHQKAGGRDL